MKKLFQLLIALLLPLTVLGQKEYLSRLTISGAVSELGISPSEEIWVATRAGNVYYTEELGGLWKIGPFGTLDSYNSDPGQSFERLNFFSEDTLMISGFIQEGGKQDFVIWSGNHGKTWEKVVFGKSSWIDAACINGNGKAWMSGSSQLIYYTEDRGKTWTSFNKVEPTGNLRFSTIHFAEDERTGLFGSGWNVLYRTVDNCKHWEKLATPLSQKKYERLSKNERLEIRKARIFGDHYILSQQGRVFITKSDSIAWQYLPEASDFEVSENEDLYVVNKDLSISIYDKAFSKIWNSSERIEAPHRAIGIRNNSLFVLTGESIYKIRPGNFRAEQLFTDEKPIDEPDLKLGYKGEVYGFSNRDILRFDTNKGRWFRFMTLNFSIGNACVFEDKVLLADGGLNKQYVVDLKQRDVTEYSLPAELFSGLTVDKVYFEKGSQGCFHNSSAVKVFKNYGDMFSAEKKIPSTEDLPIPNRKIETSKIEQIISELDRSRNSKISLHDLKITNTDIIGYKRFIDNEEQRIKKSGIDRFDFENLYNFPGENTDFNFYKSIADSLSSISEENINNAFSQSYGNWSTSTDWTRITFLFQNGKKLVVQNADDKPNYLYTPWIVDFDGLKFKSNSINFGRQLDEITAGQFFNKTIRDKNYALFKIADYFYKSHLH
ncbi:WD40/YVTN/BNR-like repeat-containing protein [Desertivirga arenae]|uniref:WD40/YVTN/BNR-like repeat-containing protein n=1 Tax=Desertivirga arenae TaxID=2810309 RepID=UPI001A96D64E|nr:hypothetical protein [Pedobacter sp. SYSU D00823]